MSVELGVSMPRKAGPDRFLGDACAAPGLGDDGLLDADQPVRCRADTSDSAAVLVVDPDAATVVWDAGHSGRQSVTSARLCPKPAEIATTPFSPVGTLAWSQVLSPQATTVPLVFKARE